MAEEVRIDLGAVPEPARKMIGLDLVNLIQSSTGQVDVFPTLAEGADYRTIISAAITRATALAADNGGHFALKLHPGEYHFSWDGVSGWDSGLGISTAALNYRSIFVIDNAAVTHVTLDFTGAVLVQKGEDKDTWASLFYIADAEVDIIEGNFDMENRTFTQGTCTAIGADYYEFEVDEEFDPTQTPSFAQISEVIRFSDVTLGPDRPERTVTTFPLDRDEYSDLFAPLVSQGSGVYRITGLSGAEVTALTNQAPVGAYVLVRGMADGACTFSIMNSPRVHVRNSVCHNAIMRFVFCNRPENASFDNVKVIPPAWSKNVVACTMRGAIDCFNSLGPVSVQGGELYGAGDDAIGLTGMALSRMEYISATSFKAFSNSHFFNGPAPVGSRFFLYDADFAEVAQGKITAVGAVNPSDDWLATYTVSITSGALPADMSDHIMPLTRGLARARVNQVKIQNIRGRGIWTSLAGNYDDNDISWTANEAILVQPTEGGGAYADTFYQGGEGISASRNYINGACRNTFYPAAIRILGTEYTLASDNNVTVSAAKPYKNVKVDGNTILRSGHAAILVGGIEGLSVRNNDIYSAQLTGSSGEEVDLAIGQTVIAYINVSDAHIDGNKGRSLGGATFIAGFTHGTGTNEKIARGLNWNLDATTIESYTAYNIGSGKAPGGAAGMSYKPGANSEHVIEADGTFNATLVQKNGAREGRIVWNSSGWSFNDTTAGATRFNVSADGYHLPGADNTYDKGSTSLRWRDIFSRRYYVGAVATMPFIGANAGSPEGSITAPVGSIYMRTDGGAVTSFYVKESGSGNTGWVAK